MSIPAEVRQVLAMQRESFAHSTGYQDGLAVWWGRIRLEDRRLLLAFAGLDDSEENARRPWRLHLQDQRDKLVSECKAFGRIIEGLKWF